MDAPTPTVRTYKRFYVQRFDKESCCWFDESEHSEWITAMFAQDELARRNEGQFYRVIRAGDAPGVPRVFMQLEV